MKESKSLVVFIVFAAVAVIVVVIVGIMALFSGGDDTEGTPSEDGTSTATGEPAEAVVEGVAKDSILKSVDSGLTFETYFTIPVTAQVGAVDVLNIIFHPTVQDKIVVSTYDDGLFKNENKVNMWQPIEFPPKKIYSFILDVVDPDNRAFASGVVSENGRIYRTDDNGASWRAVYAEPGDRTFVSALTQDPFNNNVIIAGTSAGTLIRSIDGGDTWKNIGQKITGKVTRFTHDSTRPSYMYLLVNNGKVYHSADGGQTWLNWEEEKSKEIKSLNEQASKLSRAGNKAGADSLKAQAAAIQERNRTEKAPSGIVHIVADPTTSGVLYAGLSKGLYRSTDYGKYWQKINIIESAERFPILSVAVNPEDSNEISFVAGNSFYRSVNYGATWAVTPLDKSRNASFVAYDPNDPTVIFVGLSAKQ